MTAPAPPLLIDEIQLRGDRVQVRAEQGFTSDFLQDDFFATYEGISVEGLDSAVLTVPFLLNVAPIVWSSGATYRIRSLDATFADALGRIKGAFEAMYPRTEWSGSIVVENQTRESLETTDKVGVLFSGGVDSIHASLRNREHQQELITIWGLDVALDNTEGWRRVRADSERFAGEWKHEARFIRSNIREFVKRPVRHTSPEIPGWQWWAYVRHGIGLAGLCMPLLVAEGLSTLVLAASHTSSFWGPWGSHPSLDGNVAWDGISVRHEGYDASRQQKLRYIKGVAHEHGPMALRVCDQRYGDGGNCGRCEKCLRTATGLMAEGERPQAWGIDVAESTVHRRVRRGFATLSIRMRDNRLFMWRDIQRRAAEAPGLRSRRFAAWLTGFDFDAYMRRRARRDRVMAGIRRVMAGIRRRVGNAPVAGRVTRRAAR